jgi:hypothetical protein
MDYVTASSMEWMEMDARTIHFHAVVEWIASLDICYSIDSCELLIL